MTFLSISDKSEVFFQKPGGDWEKLHVKNVAFRADLFGEYDRMRSIREAYDRLDSLLVGELWCRFCGKAGNLSAFDVMACPGHLGMFGSIFAGDLSDLSNLRLVTTLA